MSIWGDIKHGAEKVGEKVGDVVTGGADKAGHAVTEQLSGLTKEAWEKVERVAHDVFDSAMAALVARAARKAFEFLAGEAEHAARGAIVRIVLPVVPAFLHLRVVVRLADKVDRLKRLKSHPPNNGHQWVKALTAMTDHDTVGVIVRLPIIGTVLDQDMPLSEVEAAIPRLAKRALKLL